MVSELALRLSVWLTIVVVASLNITRSVRADDVWSFQTALLPIPDLLNAVRADVHPPLYFLLLHPWVCLFGPNELSGRLLSIFFHLAATFVVFALGRRIAGRDLGMICAAIYAFAPLAVLSAELIRMYSLAGLLAASAIWCWLNASGVDAKPRHWAGLITVVALGSFTHIWMLCFILALAFASIVHFRTRAVRLLAAISVALLPFTFVWLPILAAQAAISGEAAAWLKPPLFQTLGELAFLHCGATLLFLLLFLSPAIRRRRPLAGVPPWTLTLYAATLLPPLAISFWKPFFFARFTIVALPALAIALGCLLSRIKPAPLAASIAAIALIFFIGSKAGSPKCDARCAAGALLGQAADDDAIIFGSLSRPPVDYYLHGLTSRERREWVPPQPPNRERGGRLPYEQSFPIAIDSHPGYEGAHLRAVDLEPLRLEAQTAVNSFVQTGVRRVYFLAGYRRQIDAPLIGALKQHYRPLPSLLKCDRGDYFTEILVFERAGAGAR